MDRFKVFKVEKGNLQALVDVFKDLLTTAGMKSGSPRYAPLENTIRYVQNLGAVTILVQYKVQDPDFLAEHSAYYSKWTHEVPRFCERLHLFSVEAVSEDPLQVIDQMADIEDSYLGFVTLRPIRVSPQGATILKAPDKKSLSFILSKDYFKVNIAGRSFVVLGTPFMQQDNAVGACAQASIWMALRTLRQKEGQSAFSPAQITSAATKFMIRGRTLPNRDGLFIEQIMEAIRASGYAPHVIPLRDIHQPVNASILLESRRTLYSYVESGIPVMLILFPRPTEGHAVLLIGHGWDSNPTSLALNCSVIDGQKIDAFDASSWIKGFYIHNDNTGPYILLPDNDQNQYSLGSAVFAIPFLHTDVFIDASEAKITTYKLLEESLRDLNKMVTGGSDSSPYPKFVTRTYLQDKAEFRKSVNESNIPNEIKDYYRKKWLPKRIWITEISLFDTYGESPNNPPIRVGEILLDPASEPEDGCFLSIHLGPELLPKSDAVIGVIIDRDAFSGEINAFGVDGRLSYPLVR